ncbi:MAG: selenocysteine-specific translation elongation factor [Solirubrobacterales bacterium]
MAERALTLGTAGHIDHGKTALVEALTGKRTDRLAEERRRGISIELGFAELELPSGPLSVVDVPGHERLVRTMVAGATGIDLYCLVVAADDGPMPQTAEHLTVLRALGIERGVVALTKCDLVDPARRREAAEQVRALLPGGPICEVSARTGEGLDRLRDELDRIARLAGDVEPSVAGWPQPPVLHVDRAFTLTGIGTIVTGTLRRGSIRAGDRVRVLPRGISARVRSLESHDRAVDPARPGSRVAINLAGVARDEVARGDVINSEHARVKPSFRLDVELFEPLAAAELAGRRIQVHHGTRDVPARVVPITDRIVQLRLNRQLIALPDDRVVLREIAPVGTLGGAVVIDPSPPRHGQSAAERVTLIRDGEPESLLAIRSLPADRWAEDPVLHPALHRFPEERWAEAAERIAEPASAPAPKSGPKAPGPRAEAALALLRSDGVRPRTAAPLAEALGCTRSEAVAALDELVAAGDAVRVGPELYFPAAEFERLRATIIDTARERGSISIAEARDAIATGRRHAQALLEYLDGQKVTIRRGDRHVLRTGALERDN